MVIKLDWYDWILGGVVVLALLYIVIFSKAPNDEDNFSE